MVRVVWLFDCILWALRFFGVPTMPSATRDHIRKKSRSDYIRKGYRSGESHPHAKLTDSEVDLLRGLREDSGWSIYMLAEKFEISVRSVRDLVSCRRR